MTMREKIVAEALTWIGTPYKNHGGVKGAGTNCAVLLYEVYRVAGALPTDTQPPRWFAPQLCIHRKDERLIEYVKSYGAVEIEEAAAQPGDIVLYRNGLAFGHGGIIVAWPTMLHAAPGIGVVLADGAHEGVLAQKERRFFTLWP